MPNDSKELLQFGPFTLDTGDRVLWRGSELVPLTPKAFDLLAVLVQNPGRVLSKTELIERVWPDAFVEEANLSHQVYRLRAALGDGEADASYIDTLNRRGYRFIAPVTPVVPVATPAAVTTAAAPAAIAESVAPVVVGPPPRRQRLAVRALVIAASIAIFLLYAGAMRRSANSLSVTAAPIETLAVLPFTALAPPARDEPLELGMTDAIITRLTSVRQVIVRPTTAVLRYAQGPLDAIAIGKEQRVDAVLEGKIQRAENRIRVTVQLLRVSDGRPLWAQTFDQPAQDLFTIQDAISGRVVDALRVTLTAGERAKLESTVRPRMEAYDAYVRGLYHANSFAPDSAPRAVEEFRRALTLEPDYAEASAGLAAALAFIGFTQPATQAQLTEARTLAARALHVNPDSPDAHVAALNVALYVDWNWDTADRESQWLIEHVPNDARAQNWRGWYLLLMGRAADALEPLRAAQRLDPLSISITAALGEALVESGDAGTGIPMKERAATAAPRNGAVRVSLAEALFASGRGEEAVAVLRREPTQLGPPVDAALGFFLARTGHQDEARQLLKRLLEGTPPAPAYLVAEVFAGLGDASATMKYLERAYAEHSGWIVFLKSEHFWDSMRSDPRFQALLRRVSLDR